MEETEKKEPKNIWKKIGSIAFDVLIVLIFGIAILSIVGAVNRTNGVANIFGYCANSVQTDSMSGTLEVGDLVVGKVVDENTKIISDSEDYKNNSIISFWVETDSGTTYVNTHRVVGTYEVSGLTYYITQGDNRERCPEPDNNAVPRNKVICVYAWSMPGVGGFMDFLKKPLGFILVVVVPLSLLIVYEAYRVIKIYMDGRKAEMVAAAKDTTSDDVKNAIIAQYLAEHANEAKPEAKEETPAKEDSAPKDEAEPQKTDDTPKEEN